LIICGKLQPFAPALGYLPAAFSSAPRLASMIAEEIGHSSTFQPMAWFSFCTKARFRCHTTYLSSIITPWLGVPCAGSSKRRRCRAKH